MIFEQWDVVVAPFPFVERARQKPRPVIVLSSTSYQQASGLLIVVMIKTASEGRWSTDHERVDLGSTGLKHRCVVRWKMATSPASVIGRRIGALADIDRRSIRVQVSALLPWRAST